MISVTITTSGTEKLKNFNLGQLQPPMKQSSMLIKTEMQKYPAPPPRSRYRRTYRLRKNWNEHIKAGGNSLEAEITNSTPYGPFVQDDAQQAGIHRGRWQTDEMVATEQTPTIVGYFDSYIESYFG